MDMSYVKWEIKSAASSLNSKIDFIERRLKELKEHAAALSVEKYNDAVPIIIRAAGILGNIQNNLDIQNMMRDVCNITNSINHVERAKTKQKKD